MSPFDQVGTRWSTMTRKAKMISIFASAIAAVLGAIVSAPAAWRVAGLPVVATQAHVEGRIAPLMRSIEEVSQETAEIRRSQIDKEVFEWRVKLPDVSDPQMKGMIEGRLSTLQEERTVVIERLRDLRRARAPPQKF